MIYKMPEELERKIDLIRQDHLMSTESKAAAINSAIVDHYTKGKPVKKTKPGIVETFSISLAVSLSIIAVTVSLIAWFSVLILWSR